VNGNTKYEYRLYVDYMWIHVVDSVNPCFCRIYCSEAHPQYSIVLCSTLQYITVHKILECLYLNKMDFDIEIDDIALSQICAEAEFKYHVISCVLPAEDDDILSQVCEKRSECSGQHCTHLACTTNVGQHTSNVMELTP
jgi:hypothetical protein